MSHEHTVRLYNGPLEFTATGECGDPDCRAEIEEEIAGLVLDWLEGMERSAVATPYIQSYERPLLEAARRYRELLKEDAT